jgi:ABC-2 type transport system permease protein
MRSLPPIHGFLRLTLFILRRDRLWLALWMGGLLVLGTFFAPMIVGVVGDSSAQAALKEILSNPAMVAMCGPSYSDGYTYGGMYAQFMLVWAVIAFAVMNIMFVIRHTRRDEEEGRSEMAGALPVGRSANLFAVVVALCAVNAILSVLTGVALALFGVETIDLRGSLVFGCALGANGIFFAGVAALSAQLFVSARSALGTSLGVLGAAYLLRAVGDVGSETMARLSPLGLAERSEIYVNNYIWPELVLVSAGLAVCAVAFLLNAKRDSGHGMLPVRNGRAHASVFLRGGLGLIWRLSRGMAIAWSIAVFIMAAAYGSVFADFDSFVANNSLYQAMLGIGADTGDIMPPVIATMTLITTIMATIPVVMATLRLKTEESRGRMEQILAGSVSRARLIICEIAVAVPLAFALQTLTALGMYGAAAMAMDKPPEIILFIAAAMNFLPAMLIFISLGIIFVGAAPRLSALIWVYLAYSFFVAFLGDVLDMPGWVESISVFSLLPRYPAEAVEPLRAVALCAASVLLAAAGTAAYRRRDIA